jgi:hypothetical protein
MNNFFFFIDKMEGSIWERANEIEGFQKGDRVLVKWTTKGNRITLYSIDYQYEKQREIRIYHIYDFPRDWSFSCVEEPTF